MTTTPCGWRILAQWLSTCCPPPPRSDGHYGVERAWARRSREPASDALNDPCPTLTPSVSSPSRLVPLARSPPRGYPPRESPSSEPP